MEKNSFTLFETLISITLLIVVVSGFLNSSYNDEKALNTSALLNTLDNDFTLNNYSTFTRSNKELTIIKNNNIQEYINVKKHSFENENIKIFKYEK